MKLLGRWCLVAVLLSCLVGCEPGTNLVADRLSLDPHASGDEQCALHNETLKKPFRVLVEGPQQPGLLGGKGGRGLVKGADVTFTIMNPESGATFENNAQTTYTTKTNPAGNAEALLRTGQRPGDIEVQASTKTESGVKRVLFHATAGVERIGNDQETSTGGTLEDIGLRLQNSDGTPAVGVPVYFHVDGETNKSGAKPDRVETDENGEALTNWKLGEKIQRYFLSAEIRDNRTDVPETARFQARAIRFNAMAVDKRAMLVTLFGGLAIFIFGMKLMSEGLQRMADRRLKAVLQAMTRNRFMSVGVGALLTAVVQSSSATTVMVVGFVNAGLITLTQAIGVIFGANIGTTITAQIIAFKLDSLAYPAIGVGLVIAMMAKKPAVKAFGEAILGFGLLFLGMTTMSGILKPLRYSPDFRSLFQIFDCTPIDGSIPMLPALMAIVIGALATFIVQSSSATVGLVLALSSQGLLSFYTAVPLILGTNIGTTITAALASIAANRNAKRAALAHTLFNVLGSAYMYLLLFVPAPNGQPIFLAIVNAITQGNAFAPVPENLVRHVANAHTAFNIFNCLLFMPFVGLLATLCRKIIPVTDADRETVLQYLEPHLLQSPTLALEQAVKEVRYMVGRAQKSLNEGCELFAGGPNELEKKITAREVFIDRLQQEITGYLVEISDKPLLPVQASLIPALIHAVNDAERIGDHAEELIELFHIREDNKHVLPERAMKDIERLRGLLNHMFEATYKIIEDGDADAIKTVFRREAEITEFIKHVTETHVQQVEKGECEVQAGVIFLDFLTHLERCGDHLTNIAERAGRIVQAIER